MNRDLLYKKGVKKASRYRAIKRHNDNQKGKKKAHPLSDEQVDEMVHFKKLVNQRMDEIEKRIRGLIGV